MDELFLDIIGMALTDQAGQPRTDQAAGRAADQGRRGRRCQGAARSDNAADRRQGTDIHQPADQSALGIAE